MTSLSVSVVEGVGMPFLCDNPSSTTLLDDLLVFELVVLEPSWLQRVWQMIMQSYYRPKYFQELIVKETCRKER